MAIVLSSLLSAGVCAGAPLRGTFVGNAGWKISDGRETLWVDFPYQSGAFGYQTYPPSALRRAGKTYCLFTHAHADHFAPDLVARCGCVSIGPPFIRRAGPLGRSRIIQDRLALPPIMITAVATEHSPDHRSYLVEWSGARLYFTGDTDSLAALGSQRGLDAVFITPWLLEACRKSGMVIDARRVIVDHRRPGEHIDCGDCFVPETGEAITLSK